MFQSYNTFEYNTMSYNATVLNLLLFEAQSSVDAETANDNIFRAETQASLDAITKSFSRAALTESLLLEGSFFSESDLNIFNTLMLVEQTVTKNLGKLVAETQASIDSLTNQPTKLLFDAAFLSDFVRREITNKALPETVKVNTWLSVLRKPPVSNWEG